MAMVCHLGFAQDTDSTDTASEHRRAVSASTKIKIDLVRHKKNGYFGIDPTLEFGWNRFMDNGSLSLSSANSDLRLEKGPEFSFYPIVGGVYLDKGHFIKVSTALGITWNTYHFEKPITLQKDQDALHYTIDETRHFSKNLLRSKYLTMPVVFSIYPAKDSKFEINLGAEGGLLLGAKTKQISDENGKVKVRGNFNLNPVRYGLRFGMGYDNFNIYAKYYLSDVFANGEGPKDFRTVAIGINFGFF